MTYLGPNFLAATVLAGLLQIVAGYLKLSVLAGFVSRPAITQ